MKKKHHGCSTQAWDVAAESYDPSKLRRFLCKLKKVEFSCYQWNMNTWGNLDFEPNAFMLMSGKHQGYHLDIRINFTNRSTSKYSFAYSPSKFKTDYQPGCACAARHWRVVVAWLRTIVMVNMTTVLLRASFQLTSTRLVKQTAALSWHYPKVVFECCVFSCCCLLTLIPDESLRLPGLS
jgi:hypothetical protein